MKEINIVALEIGSSRVKGAVGSVDQSGALTVKAVEEEPITDCVRYGVLSNVEEVSNVITSILERLENRINGYIDGVYLSIGGRSFRTDHRSSERRLPQEMEITPAIIEDLMKETAASVDHSRELLDVVPYEYYVNNTRVTKPIGSLGSDIRMLSNVITCRPQIKRNLVHLIDEKLGLDIRGYVVRQVAQAEFALQPEERRLGCMLVDFGAETTSVSIYKQGHLRYMVTLPMGSHNITLDLTHLNYVVEKAEEIKRRYGNARSDAPVENVQGLDLSSVNRYVSFRAGEIIANIKNQLTLAGYAASDLPAGIVLVGHGARLNGFSERLGATCAMKVRFGTAARTNVRLAESRFSISDAIDVVSALYYVASNHPEDCISFDEPVQQPVVEVKPEVEPKEEVKEEPVKDEKDKNKGKNKSKGAGNRTGLFAQLANRMAKMLEETDEDDEDDSILKDDE